MKVLGLSYDFHDASAALVANGQVIAAASEERFTRQKHDQNFPQLAIEFCLEKAGLGLGDIDKVVFYERPSRKFTRILASNLASWPLSLPEFSASMKAWLGKKLWTKALLASRLGLDPSRIGELDHHFSHAAQSFLASGFEESAILVVDAVGEWSTCSIGHGKWENGKPVIRLLQSSEYPHSLGLVYSAFTEFLGFKAMNDECSTMALAAFGRPVFRDLVEEIVEIEENGALRVSSEYLQFERFFRAPFTKKFHEAFGPAFRGRYKFSSLETECRVSPEEQHYADVAASVQLVFEERLLELARIAARKTGSGNLSYAGGGALNCVANTRLIKESGFRNVFVPTEPGDGGAALGAALFGYFDEAGGVAARRANPYLGASHEADSDLLPFVDVPSLRRFRKKGLTSEPARNWKWNHFSSTEEMAGAVARRLFEGKSVGWMQGGFEFGPRALGNRSILFRPDDTALARKVSTQVKERAPFRPYALAMTEKAGREILEWERWDSELIHWMQAAVPVKEEFRPKVSAGLHTDGTTRPQVVKENDTFTLLLRKYGDLSGLECLVNTSFNENDYPIVNHSLEGLILFARTDLDVLVINNLVIEKGEL